MPAAALSRLAAAGAPSADACGRAINRPFALTDYELPPARAAAGAPSTDACGRAINRPFALTDYGLPAAGVPPARAAAGAPSADACGRAINRPFALTDYELPPARAARAPPDRYRFPAARFFRRTIRHSTTDPSDSSTTIPTMLRNTGEVGSEMEVPAMVVATMAGTIPSREPSRYFQ